MPNRLVITVVVLLLAATLTGCGAAQPVGTAAPSATQKSISITPTPSPAAGSLEAARALIAGWLKREVPDFNMDSLSDLEETDLGIEHLYELTETRFYTLGSFLYTLHGGNVSRLYCLTTLDALLEDMDGDSKDELVLLCDNGSGLYVYQLFIVKGGAVYEHTIESTAGEYGYRLGTMCSCGVQLLKVQLENGQEAGAEVVGVVMLRDGQVVVE